MKKIAVSLLCAVMACSLFAAEPEKEEEKVDYGKRIAELQAERGKLVEEMVRTRRGVIRYDKHAAKRAKEILTLNRQLSEYLNTKPEIRELNSDLGRIDRQLNNLRQRREEQLKKEKQAKTDGK